MLVGIGYSQCNESNWQEYYNSEGHNMVGCDLEGASLGGAYLDGANLDGANLSGAYLGGAYLDGAYLTGANLSGAYLMGASLNYAKLSDANLTGANLSWAYLFGVYLYGTNLCNLAGSGNPEAGLGECEQPEGITDDNGDGYDDVSYEAGANSADPCYGVVCDDDPEMICICGECTYEDEQGDTGGAEDCSYGDECFETGAESGDLNLDGADNVQDVVILVNNILNP